MLKRRPSNFTLQILKLLYERGPLPSATIAAKLGVDSRYVASYLSYLKKRNMVRYVDGLWELTDEGREYIEKILSIEEG